MNVSVCLATCLFSVKSTPLLLFIDFSFVLKLSVTLMIFPVANLKYSVYFRIETCFPPDSLTRYLEHTLVTELPILSDRRLGLTVQPVWFCTPHLPALTSLLCCVLRPCPPLCFDLLFALPLPSSPTSRHLLPALPLPTTPICSPSLVSMGSSVVYLCVRIWS